MICLRSSPLLCLAALIIPFGLAGRSARAQDTPALDKAGESVPVLAAWRETLPSGLRLIVQTRRGAMLAAVDLRVRVGSGNETAATGGTAHFIEHLVFKGGGSRKPGDFDRAMETLGGEIAARTTRDATQYATVVPTAKWREATGLLAEMVQNPGFRAEDMESERVVIQAEVAVAQTDTARLGFGQITQVAFQAQEGYRLPLMGSADDVAHRTPDEVRAFWKTWYQPWNLTLTLVGDINADDARRLAEALFPTPDSAAPRRSLLDVTTLAGLGRVVRAAPLAADQQADRALSTLLMGFRVPGGTDAPTLALFDTLVSLLVGDEQGKLYDALRVKQHLASSVSAEFLPGRQGGLLLIRATMRAGDAPRAERAILDELRRLHEDGVSDSDVTNARAVARGRFLYETATVEGAASRLANFDLLSPTLLPDAYLASIDKIQRDTLEHAIARYLTSIEYAVAIIGQTTAPAADGESAR